MSTPPTESDARTRAEAEVRERLAGQAATTTIADARLEPIPGGVSNFSWRATNAAGAWFVRLAHPLGAMLGADRVNECRVLRSVAGAGVAPRIVCCDPANRLLVTRWIDTGTTDKLPRASQRRAQTAATLARVHALAVPTGARDVDFAMQARELETRLPSTATIQLAPIARHAFEWLAERPVPLVLCHNDLNPLNVLFDQGGRLWLVDWEYAGRGEAAFDLASYASQHTLRSRERQMLVQHYRAAGGEVDEARMAAVTWAFDYVQWLWYRAALESGGAVADRAATVARACQLERSLHRRALTAPHWNNAPFAGFDGRV
jgi:aminoglycoside phosphotransferase (APT) family kinase protein